MSDSRLSWRSSSSASTWLWASETIRRDLFVDEPLRLPKTIAAAVITLVLYWLAHSYADLAGERLRSGARLTARGLLATMLRELPILIGATIPLALLVGGLLGALIILLRGVLH